MKKEDIDKVYEKYGFEKTKKLIIGILGFGKILQFLMV